MKRIFLFILTNILVMVTVSIVLRVLGVGNYLTAAGINYGALMVFCLVVREWVAGVVSVVSGWSGLLESLVTTVRKYSMGLACVL